MVVTVRATEYDLPPSRIKQYIDDKEAEGRSLEEARANVKTAQAAYDAAKIADDAALVAVNKAMEGVADVTYENLTAELKAAKENLVQALVTLNNCDMAYEAAKSSYNTASKALVKAEDAVSTNKYEILIKNADGTQVFNGPVYGSKAAAEKIALYYELAYKRTIKVTAYTLDRTSTLFPWVLNPDRTVDTTDLTKAWIDANSAKWATDDAAALVKAQTAFNTAEENLKTAAANFTAAKQAVELGEKAVATAQNRLNNITYLQAEAQRKLFEAESKKSKTQAALNTANAVLAAALIAEANAEHADDE